MTNSDASYDSDGNLVFSWDWNGFVVGDSDPKTLGAGKYYLFVLTTVFEPGNVITIIPV